MSDKFEYYSDLAERSTGQLTKSRESWTNYLTTAARLYKYPFDEQLMIYAQRPNATACATMETWNKPMNRFVRRGSKGIALIDNTNERPKLKYVFDVSDTEDGRYNARRPFQWELKPEHGGAVMEALSKSYGDVEGDLGGVLYSIAKKLAMDYYNDNSREVGYSAEGSFLEDLDDFNIGVAYREALTISTAYSLMSRCGVDPADYISDEDFQCIFDFNTTDSITTLGTGVSALSEQVLREIEITIKNYERQKNAERGMNYERIDVQRTGGLSDTRFGAEGTGVRADREVRHNAPQLYQGTPPRVFQHPSFEREAVPAPVGDRQDGERADGAVDVRVDNQEPAAEQGDGADGVGIAHEQSAPASGGNDTERVDLRPVEQEKELETPPEQELSNSDGVFLSGVLASSAISLEAVDAILRDGGNQKNSVLHIAAYFSKSKTPEENAEFLSREYTSGGKGFQIGTQQISAWFDETGITLGVGKSATQTRDKVHITWEQAAARVKELFDAGLFVSRDTMAQTIDNEHRELAERLLFFYRDDMRGFREVPEEWNSETGGFPADMEIVKELLADKDGEYSEYNLILNRLEEDINALKTEPDAPTRFWHSPSSLLRDIRDNGIPPKDFPANTIPVVNFMPFITEDEVNKYLTQGANVVDSKYRIFSFFLNDNTTKEKVDFLKDEYGTGGGTHALSRADNSYADTSPSTGITLSRGSLLNPYDKVNLTWSNAVSRIDRLINDGQYMSRAELDRIPEYEKEILARKVNSFYYDVSPDIERPFSSNGYFDTDAKAEILEILNDPGKVDALLEAMKPVLDNTPMEDRRYKARQEAYTDLTAYRNGTFTLFPHLAAITPPELARTVAAPAPTTGRTIIEKPSVNSPSTDKPLDTLLIERPEPSEQLTLFSFMSQPPLPSVAAQREIIEEAERTAEELTSPAVSVSIEQSDIDAALRSWNGDLDSKILVHEYMNENARARETANFLKEEYGGDLPAFVVTKSGAEDVSLPWPKVQRRIAQLINDGQFLTPEEQAYVDREYSDIRETIAEESEENAVSEPTTYESLLNEALRTPSGESYSNRAIAGVLLQDLRGTRIDPVDFFNRHQARDYNSEQAAIIRGLLSRALEHDALALPEGERLPSPFPVTSREWESADTAEKLESPEGNKYLLLMRNHYAELMPVAIDDVNGHELHKIYFKTTDTELSGEVLAYSTQEAARLIPFENYVVTFMEPMRGETDRETPEATRQDALGSPPPVFFSDWETARNDINIRLYNDRDVIGYNKDGVEYSVMLSGGYTFINTTSMITPWGEVLGDKDIPDNILEQIRAYRSGNLTDEQVQENYLDVLTAYTELREIAENQPTPDTLPVQSHEAATPETSAIPEPTAVASEMPSTAVATRQTPAVNFRITDDHLGEGGAKTKYGYNIAAIKTLQTIEAENRRATPEEQEILSRYVGWGGLPQAFDSERDGWQKEFAELKDLLTPTEYDMARASTLNAHYTSPTVIKSIYETVERMGFTTGNILEPACGVGNFYGLLPDSMQGSKLYGVELDSITGRIAGQLYQKADITVSGFEKSNKPDAFFDLAIGNVPFGNYKVVDKRYDKHNFNIHDYFFAKTLDQVRPGGIVAFVTSKGTLDKQNPEIRKYIAQRAELLGAVRLPNDAFLKNAGTEVTSDIIFLQRRDRLLDIQPDWVHLGQTEDDVPVNSYFAEHPEMVLGTMAYDDRMYGNNSETTCVPVPGANLTEQLKTALANIQGQITEAELDDVGEIINAAIPADPDVRNFSFTIVDDRVYFRENSLMYPVDLPAATLERVRGMTELRDCVHELIDFQLDEYGDDIIRAKQTELNTLYDDFTDKFGLINNRANNQAFSADSAYYLLCSLEILDENGELDRKADMFSKRTIKQKTVITSVDTASEALAVSISERACVDIDFMQNLTGFTEEKLIKDLEGVIFYDFGRPDQSKPPFDGISMKLRDKYPLVTADEYLSGNVREKLYRARNFNEAVGDIFHGVDTTVNIKALEMAQPKDLDASEISARLGSTWIDKSYVQQFMYELLKTPYHLKSIYEVKYSAYTSEWNVTGTSRSSMVDVTANVTYGTQRMNAYKIIEETLNLRDARVYDTVYEDGKEKRVLNKKETMLAQQKQEQIKQAFKDWVFTDPQRRHDLVKLYNERFNSCRPREYDGSHISLSGVSPEINMRPHQLNAIAHILYGGNTLLAHVVGAGKTFEMVAAAMESKRLGLCQKSLFAVPNHLTEQTASEFLRLYPLANILVATKKDFEMRNRRKFCAKIATGDYDAVIIGHSQLEKVPLSMERQQRLIMEQIWEITEGIEELSRQRDTPRFTIKQLEKTKKSLEARLEKLMDSKKKDDVVTFEQLGVDRLFVDEAHGFKNLFAYTKMRNVAGLSQTEAQKSSDLFGKCRYMDEITGGKGIIFATGTPVSNSMMEMFTLQRYLQHDVLQRNGLNHFDSWASTFGETTTALELAPEGNGYRARTRFAKFHNLPELMNMFKEVADIKTADMLDLPRPKAVFQTIVAEPSEIQREMVADLSERATKVQRREVDPSVDNMLKITSDGRKIGLDQRLMNPLLPDDEDSKVNACTNNVFRVWEETKIDRLTQLVFCDISTPNADGRFNVYSDIRDKLIAKGIPTHEIAFIHDANTETQKKELFAKVRQGKVRVLMGSTFKMGSGTNVQDRLIMLHDLDCPWRPSDLEQRSGRIIRQGNMNPEVTVCRYVTESTFDAYLYQTIENKQKFISQIMSSKSPVRSCEDVDESALSYAEIKALCAGNPLIRERMDLEIDVSRLRLLKADHQSQHYRLEDNILKFYPESIEQAKGNIAGYESDMTRLEAHTPKAAVNVEMPTTTEIAAVIDASAAEKPKAADKAKTAEPFPPMEINGVVYTEKDKAGAALLVACTKIGSKEAVKIGSYRGFDMSLSFDTMNRQFNVTLKGAMSYSTVLGTDVFGNITRINNAFAEMPSRLMSAQIHLNNLNQQLENAKQELQNPFPNEQELTEKSARLALIDAELDIGGKTFELPGADVSEDVNDDVGAAKQPPPNINAGAQEIPKPKTATQEHSSAKTVKPSILDGLKSFLGRDKPADDRPDKDKTKKKETEI